MKRIFISFIMAVLVFLSCQPQAFCDSTLEVELQMQNNLEFGDTGNPFESVVSAELENIERSIDFVEILEQPKLIAHSYIVPDLIDPIEHVEIKFADIEGPIELIDVEESDELVNEEEPVFKRSEGILYEFMDDHDYLFAPILGSVTGAARFGGYFTDLAESLGFDGWSSYALGYTAATLFGAALGAVDELLVYSGITKRRNLTWMIIGLAVGDKTKKGSTATNIVGIAVGALLPNGVLNGYGELVAPALTYAAGNSRGISSQLGGFADEALMNLGLTDRHYLTFAVLGTAATDLLGWFGPTTSTLIGTALGLGASLYEENIISRVKAPIDAAISSYEVSREFIPKDQLDDHYEKKALVSIGSNFLTQYLSLKSQEIGQKIPDYIVGLKGGSKNPAAVVAWTNLKSQALGVVFFSIPLYLGEMLLAKADGYFNKRMQVALEDKINSKVFDPKIAQRFAYDDRARNSLKESHQDISTVVNSGDSLIRGAVSSAMGGIFGFGLVLVKAPDMFLYSVVYSQAKDKILDKILDKNREVGKKMREIEFESSDVFEHDMVNIEILAERDGMGFMGRRANKYVDDLREFELEMMRNNMWLEGFWSTAGTLGHTIHQVLLGKNLIGDNIPFKEKGTVGVAISQLSRLLSFGGNNARQILEINKAADGLLFLASVLNGPPSNLDKISRVVEGNKLVLKDIEVGYGRRLLVKVDNLEFEMGKVYAIKGDTGCGKSSLLSKIKCITENKVYGKGTIYYPEVVTENGDKKEMPKIVMLSQDDYFPKHTSLYEVVLFPDNAHVDEELDKQKREDVSRLLGELGLYPFNLKNNGDTKKRKKDEDILSLDSKKNWYKDISGGERKKILIASALIKKPDIFILDETFVGLDKDKSLLEVQKVIKKYLPNALILSVDHDAVSNNIGGFYDNEVSFYVADEDSNVGEHPPAQVFLLPPPSYDRTARDAKLKELLSIARKKEKASEMVRNVVGDKGFQEVLALPGPTNYKDRDNDQDRASILIVSENDKSNKVIDNNSTLSDFVKESVLVDASFDNDNDNYGEGKIFVDEEVISNGNENDTGIRRDEFVDSRDQNLILEY